MKNNMLPDALDYASRGWAVIPLHTPVKGLCTCGRSDCDKIGKHPRTEHGAKDASQDPAQIALWFDLWDNSNVGLATGKPSGFFALDIDPDHGGRESLEGLIEKHGRLPETVEDLSGGGGFHVWLAHPGFKVRNTKLAPGIDVKGDGGLIVAPHSLHKSGRHYEFEQSSHPDDVQIAYPPDWLIEALTPATIAPVEFVAPDRRAAPRLALAILAGTSKREYASRSEAEQAAICSLINAGYSFDDVLDLFSRLANPQTKFAELQRRRPREAERWLKLSYDRGLEYIKTHEHESIKIARAWGDWALSVAWPGRTGAYIQLTLFAHLEIVTRAGRLVYQAGERELADFVGCNRAAIHKANAELIKRDVIKRIKSHDRKHPEQATIWQLLPPPQGVAKSYHSQDAKDVSEWYDFGAGPVPDAFRHSFTIKKDGRTYRVKGLGKSGAQVWQVLGREKELTALQIAERTGRNKSTVIRALEAMQAQGMVTRRIESALSIKWSAKPCDLDQIAKRLGMAEAGQKQRERHAAERLAHHANLKKAGRK